MSGSALTCSAASRSSLCSAMLSAFTGGRSSRMVASPAEDWTLTNSATSVAGVVLERQAQPYPEVLDLAVLDRDVLADHFGHPQVAHGGGGGIDRFACGVFPGLLADPDNLGHAVDTHRLSSVVLRASVFRRALPTLLRGAAGGHGWRDNTAGDLGCVRTIARCQSLNLMPKQDANICRRHGAGPAVRVAVTARCCALPPRICRRVVVPAIDGSRREGQCHSEHSHNHHAGIGLARSERDGHPVEQTG